jgi:hypothetical protein
MIWGNPRKKKSLEANSWSKQNMEKELPRFIHNQQNVIFVSHASAFFFEIQKLQIHSAYSGP